jgi:hypothetical protein
MKDCYYHLGLHFILLDDSSQSYILKLRDRGLMGTILSTSRKCLGRLEGAAAPEK